jgi:hypothetical protein
VDPEPPTRRLPPQEPAPPPRGTVRETEYVSDPEREQLRDRVRSLTTALVLTALLATVALGAALYALLGDDEDDDTGRRGASPARVSSLDQRVDELDGRIDDRATKNSVDDLEERLGKVEEQAEQAGEAGGDTQELRDAIEALDQSVQQLEQRVDSLEQADSGGAETQP